MGDHEGCGESAGFASTMTPRLTTIRWIDDDLFQASVLLLFIEVVCFSEEKRKKKVGVLHGRFTKHSFLAMWGMPMYR